MRERKQQQHALLPGQQLLKLQQGLPLPSAALGSTAASAQQQRYEL
jgi:hypothetical protein